MNHTSLRNCMVGAALMVLGISGLNAQSKGPHPYARALTITGVAAKPAKIQGGDWDDKRQRVTLRVKFSNTDTKTTMTGLSATLMLLGESAIQSGVTKVLLREEAQLNLAPRETVEQALKEFETNFDRTGVKHGFAYGGWAVIVKDASGVIVTCKSTSPVIEKNPEKILAFGADKCFGRSLEPKGEPRR